MYVCSDPYKGVGLKLLMKSPIYTLFQEYCNHNLEVVFLESATTELDLMCKLRSAELGVSCRNWLLKMFIFCLKCIILNTFVCIQGLQTIIKTLKRGKLKKKKKRKILVHIFFWLHKLKNQAH